MRSLTSTLESAQQKGFINALVKIVLTHGETTYTYEKDRIIKIDETEDGELQSAEVVLHNRDGVLTDLDLKGYQAVISFGAITSAGEEYSACAPMYVVSQNFSSQPDELTCTLSLAGLFKLMMDDNASEAYIPDSDDTKSVKMLVDEIITATMGCFSHCTAYTSQWDEGYDNLADSYLPKDSFRIYTGGDRKAAIDRLLQYTANVARVENDGKIHIFKPTTTGTTYDYEYSLESGHSFFSKALRNRLVIPNYIVVKSRDDDDPSYSGYAQDAESYALLPKREYFETYLTSNDQATAIAEAKLAINQMWCDAGSASVPMNCGAEPFDYVKVTDEREDDYRVGNIGQLRRHYSVSPKGRQSSRWETTFIFGNWQTVRKALANLSVTSDELQNYFSRLVVKDLYAENMHADNLDFVWLDPDNTIDLSQIGDTLDNLPDGEVYARVKSLHLDAGQIKLDENVWYKAGYDPSTKWTGSDLDDLPDGAVYHRVKSAALTAEGLILLDQVTVGTYGLVLATDISAGHIKLSYCVGDLDDIADGGTYEKVKATDISAGHILLSACTGDIDDIDNGSSYGKLLLTDIDSGHIKLTSNTKVSGEWYDESGVEIDATHGINIYGTNQALTTRATKTGTIQCYVGSDGCIYAGAGAVKLSASGIAISGQYLDIKSSGGVLKGYLWADSNSLRLSAATGVPLTLDSVSGKIIMSSERVVLPQRTSAPSSPDDGTMIFNPSTGYTNIYSSHDGAWHHFNRDSGWA